MRLRGRRKDTDMIKAIFCGHDHVNDYDGLLDGVRLDYLRATGYSGYGGEKVKKGATLITLDLKNIGEFEAKSVFKDGSEWQPSKTTRPLKQK